MELQDRIRKVVEYSGLSITKFSKSVGFDTPQTIRELLYGRTKSLSYQALNKISTAYPEINKDWLGNGKGDMLASSASRSVRDVTKGSMVQQGDSSIMMKDVKVQIDDELANKIDVPTDYEACKREVIKLRQLLSTAEKEIARLEGKVEEQDKFISLLLNRK